jgi:hypothetical protein
MRIEELKKIDNRNNKFTFAVSKNEFDIMWATAFAKKHTPYAYDDRDAFWYELITME